MTRTHIELTGNTIPIDLPEQPNIGDRINVTATATIVAVELELIDVGHGQHMPGETHIRALITRAETTR